MDVSTASERVERALDDARSSQQSINAFTSIDDGALKRAADIDRKLERGDDVGSLAGVPIAVKDLIDHAGRITTAGSHFYRELADETAPCIARLEDAGGIFIGRTNLHEWAFGFNSENEAFGPVRNPWDTDTSAGGSSGGSGAAVAAGITPIAIGTDTGGSVRVPAALCGTYGLKTTYGAIPISGVFPLVASIDTVGPLADSMEHLEISYRVMAQDDRRGEIDQQLRFGVPEPWMESAPMGAQMAAAFDGAVEAIRAMGHLVHSIEMPDVLPSQSLIDAIGEEVSQAHRAFRERGERYSDAVAERISAAEAVTPEQAANAKAWQRMIRDRFGDAFATVDFLLTPTIPDGPKVIGVGGIGDKHHRSVLSYFTALVNHALHPAIALPLANSGAPPASLQVVGPMRSDVDLLALGHVFDEAGLTRFTIAPRNSPKTPDG